MFSPNPTYIEFVTRSNFSFLHGASHPEEIAATAARIGLTGFGLADRNSVAGVVRAHAALKDIDAKLRYHPGTRLVFADATPDIIAYPKSRKGWGNLTRLLTLGNRRTQKGACHLTCKDLLEHVADLACIVMPDDDTPHERAIGTTRAASAQNETCVTELAAAAPDAVRIAAVCRFAGDDRAQIRAREHQARRLGLPLIAVNDVLYHVPGRRPLQDVLTCIREHTTIDEAGTRLEANAERHMKSAAEMARLFRDHPAAIAETRRLSESLAFSLDELRYEYPDESVAGFATPQQALIHFTYAGAGERYPLGIPAKVRLRARPRDRADRRTRLRALLPHRLRHRPLRACQGILCQGRGSAANSAVCFCLGITEIDPEKSDLLFERFVSADRREPPDIDVDFEHARREEVIQYIYQRYGRERAGLAATVISYRARSAIREVGKAMGLAGDTLDQLSGSIWGFGGESIGGHGSRPRRHRRNEPARRADPGARPRHHRLSPPSLPARRRLRHDARPPRRTRADPERGDGRPHRHRMGQGRSRRARHPQGRCARARHAHLPEERLRACLRAITAQDWTIATLPAEDPAVYRMLCRADTLGVFQVESRAQMSMLPRLRAETSTTSSSRSRSCAPAPSRATWCIPYLRRRQGLEAGHLSLQGAGSRARQDARRAAVPGTGDAHRHRRRRLHAVRSRPLRRAMATFRKVGTISTFQDKMIDGMVANGYDRDFAERCFRQIEGFGEYGFPESHAASFALLVYASSWIKCHYPDVFAAALLNAQPLGF